MFSFCLHESATLPGVNAMSQSDLSTPQFETDDTESVAGAAEPVNSPWKSALDLNADPRWQLAQRIVASRSFAKSALLSRFLLYVCEREITGRTGEISEHQIGVRVFGRRPGYSAGEDNIVRNYARQLRQRLQQYFQEEGKDEEIRVSIPRGKYVPLFASDHFSGWLGAPEHENDEEPVEPVRVPERLSAPLQPVLKRKRYLALLLLAAGLACLVWLTVRHFAYRIREQPDPLWAQLFDHNHETLIVPSDDGIVMIQNLTGHLVPLSEYIARDYLSLKSPYNIDAQNMKDLDAQRYTNVTDLNAVLRLARLPQADAVHSRVRYARELRMQDLKDANAILLGSSFSNPWAELFEKTLNFEFYYEPHPNASHIVNRHPQGAEPPIYENDATGPSHRTYAVIGLVPNLNNTGWVLLVEGLTMAGTQAAVDTLFNSSVMRPLLAQFRNGDGSFNPFEILIETRSFGSDSPQASIVATRVYRKHS
jgi:hypothetical protein